MRGIEVENCLQYSKQHNKQYNKQYNKQHNKQYNKQYNKLKGDNVRDDNLENNGKHKN